jgi:hypothetical protein
LYDPRGDGRALAARRDRFGALPVRLSSRRLDSGGEAYPQPSG